MTQNNYRASAGIVYRFGRVGGHYEQNTTQTNRGSSSAVPIPTLGLKAATTERGVTVVEVVPGSLAEQAGLHTGDVITAVNGLPVKTAFELATACSNLTGSVKLSYLVRGYWQTVTTVPVAPR